MLSPSALGPKGTIIVGILAPKVYTIPLLGPFGRNHIQERRSSRKTSEAQHRADS